MNRAAAVPLLLVTLASITVADVVVEIRPQVRTTKHMLFVVDRSGSMAGNEFSEAIAFIGSVTRQPVDAMEFGIIRFNSTWDRWPGIPEPDATPPIPAGWAGLPSAIAVERATKWLTEGGTSGDTSIANALRAAMSESRRELTVVVVSDGLVSESVEDLQRLMDDCQARRQRAGLDRVIVSVYGIGPSRNAKLAAIAERGRGGYYRVTVAPNAPQVYGPWHYAPPIPPLPQPTPTPPTPRPPVQGTVR